MTTQYTAVALSTREREIVEAALTIAPVGALVDPQPSPQEVGLILDRFKFHPAYISTAQAEKLILERLVRDLLAEGYRVNVNDNNADRETHVEKSDNLHDIMAAIFKADIDADDYTLDIMRAANPEGSQWDHCGWIRVIEGNGASVISNYSTNLEKVVGPANALAYELEEQVSA